VIQVGGPLVLAFVAHAPHHRSGSTHEPGRRGTARSCWSASVSSGVGRVGFTGHVGGRVTIEAITEASEGPSDAELVIAVASGERAALASLYDRYASTLLGLGIRVLRSRRDAEDVVHDVFLEVWRRAHSYDPARASVRGWLLLMMRCRSLDRRKSAAFSLSTPLDTIGHEGANGAGHLAEGPSSDRAGEAIDHKRAVAALAALPDAQREVLVLGYFQGLSSSEIATELQIPIGTVKSRVAAAMRALRERMGIREAVDAADGRPT
jgi:RNA polymerase sigma-70 factor (ECF subfamily)